jgi:hypothetical protein
MSTTKNIIRKFFRFFLCIFAIIGIIFVGVYFAMQNGWLNVKGSISERNSYFNLKKNASIGLTHNVGGSGAIAAVHILRI